MSKKIYLVAGLLAMIAIATFFISTILVELLGSYESVAMVKKLIVLPGLFILIPAITKPYAYGFKHA